MFGLTRKRKPVVFITVKQDGLKAFDYPKHLPLPRIGETVSLNVKDNFAVIWGVVSDVRHTTSGMVTEISIILNK